MVNAARSSSEMQTSPSYYHIIIPTDTKVHSQSNSILVYSMACFVTYRCPDMVDFRKFSFLMSTWIFCSNMGFLVSLYGVFQNNSLAVLELAYILANG